MLCLFSRTPSSPLAKGRTDRQVVHQRGLVRGAGDDGGPPRGLSWEADRPIRDIGQPIAEFGMEQQVGSRGG